MCFCVKRERKRKENAHGVTIEILWLSFFLIILRILNSTHQVLLFTNTSQLPAPCSVPYRSWIFFLCSASLICLKPLRGVGKNENASKSTFLRWFTFKIRKWGFSLCRWIDSWLASCSSRWVGPFPDSRNCTGYKACHFLSPTPNIACESVSLLSWWGLKYNPSGHRRKGFLFVCLKCELLSTPFWCVSAHSKTPLLCSSSLPPNLGSLSLSPLSLFSGLPISLKTPLTLVYLRMRSSVPSMNDDTVIHWYTFIYSCISIYTLSQTPLNILHFILTTALVGGLARPPLLPHKEWKAYHQQIKSLHDLTLLNMMV